MEFFSKGRQTTAHAELRNESTATQVTETAIGRRGQSSPGRLESCPHGNQRIYRAHCRLVAQENPVPLTAAAVSPPISARNRADAAFATIFPVRERILLGAGHVMPVVAARAHRIADSRCGRAARRPCGFS